jgi:hypothetical protein
MKRAATAALQKSISSKKMHTVAPEKKPKGGGENGEVFAKAEQHAVAPSDAAALRLHLHPTLLSIFASVPP